MKERIEMASNVISEKNTEKMIASTLKMLSDTLSKSVGPYGCNTIIQDPYSKKHTITKDGYTIFKNIAVENDISKAVLEIIRSISLKLVNEVGDASTSSILVAYKLYDSLRKYKSDYLSLKDSNSYQKSGTPLTVIPPKTISDILLAIEEIVTEYIKEIAIPVSHKDFHVIRRIAGISNNNDFDMGGLIAEIYEKIGKDSFITIENSVSSKSYYEIAKGYEIEDGYIEDRFCNNMKDRSFDGEHPLIFMSKDTLYEKDIPMLLKLFEFSLTQQKPLVIIAKSFDTEVYNFININKVRNNDKFEICPITYTSGSQFRDAIYEDLAIYLGVEEIYDETKISSKEYTDKYLQSYESAKKFLGSCEKISVKEKETQFIGGLGDIEKRNSRLEYIQGYIDEIHNNSEREENDIKLFQYEKRYNKLEGNIAVLYVGGNTEIEKENKKYLVDDAIHAVRSALKHGYVIGGNLTVPTIINNHKNEILANLKDVFGYRMADTTAISEILDIVEKSFTYSYECVLNNRFIQSLSEIIIDECITENKIYNLVTESYQVVGMPSDYEPKDICVTDENAIPVTSVINSADTDIQIMHSVFSIIGLLITSNQFLSITTYVPEAFDHIEEV